MDCPRLDRLPTTDVLGITARVAASPASRLLGLAFLRAVPEDCALLFPRCRSVHTFGMSFAIDVVFLGNDGTAIGVINGLRPGRLAGCRRAGAILELPAGGADRLALSYPSAASA